MDIGVDIPKLAIFTLFLVLSPKFECQIWMQPKAPLPPSPQVQSIPLCATQFALGNHAYSVLPLYLLPLPSPRATTPPVSSDSSDSSPSPAHRHSHHAPRHMHISIIAIEKHIMVKTNNYLVDNHCNQSRIVSRNLTSIRHSKKNNNSYKWEEHFSQYQTE